MTAPLLRALAGIRARPASSLATAAGLLLAGAMLGAAVTTRVAITTGFDRAQRAAHAPDIVARFDPTAQALVASRITALANIAAWSARLTVRPVRFAVEQGTGLRFGAAEVDGLQTMRSGLDLVAGRGLAGPGDVLVERGLYDAWHLHLGESIGLAARGGPVIGQIVGVVVEPDNVAYPLASRPRVYIAYDVVRDLLSGVDVHQPVNAVYLRVRDPALLAITLAQLRQASFGLSTVTLQTRTGVRVAIDTAAGLVASLIAAFAVITLAAAFVMLTASGHARASRDVQTIGTLRALGFGGPALAASYALEAGVIAFAAAGVGIVAGVLIAAGPTDRLLVSLNELAAPTSTVAGVAVVVFAAAVVVAMAAAAIPVLVATRQPVVALLRGQPPAARGRRGVRGAPFWLGARLVFSRPGRLAAAVGAVGASLAVIVLMLALARLAVAVENDATGFGERYSLLVADRNGALEQSLRTPGVAAATNRFAVAGLDAFDLSEPLSVVAYGGGDAGSFHGPPLLDGRYPAAPGEASVGEGLAQTLGLAPGAPLVVDLAGGGELTLRVVGVVQDFANDGRVAYTTAATLLAAQPTVEAQVAVRASPGVSVAALSARLARLGLIRVQPQAAPGASTSVTASSASSFVAVVVALLRVLAVLNGVACAMLILLALIVLARERVGTIAILRVVGGGTRQVAALLAGAAMVVAMLALAVALVVERWLLGPAVSSLVGRYGQLPLTPAGLDAALVVTGCLASVLVASMVTATRFSAVTIVASLRVE